MRMVACVSGPECQNFAMLDEVTRRALTEMAKAANIELPDLDRAASRQDRWAIYHIIRVHDEMVSENYFRSLVDDREAAEPTMFLLDELARKRRDIVDLELKVFKHLNSLGPPK